MQCPFHCRIHLAVALALALWVLQPDVVSLRGAHAMTRGWRQLNHVLSSLRHSLPSSRAPAPAAGGINVEPSMRPWRYLGPNPDGWWCEPPNCVQHPDPLKTINAELALAHALHVAVVRLEFPWFLIEPRRGAFEWARADAIVAAARAHHVALQAILVYSPSWAAPSPDRAPMARDFSAFVSTIVRRYRSSIHYWEMWNEPDHSHYWNDGVESYVKTVLQPGYKAVKGADAKARVILGGPASANMEWLRGVYSYGGGNAFDIMAFHDYSGAGQVLRHARMIYSLMRGQGQGTKPLWLGEYGVEEENLADNTQQKLMTSVLTSRSPLTMAVWYNLRDDYSMTCCPPAPAVVAYWGLVKHDGRTKKQGFSAMQRLLRSRGSAAISSSL